MKHRKGALGEGVMYFSFLIITVMIVGGILGGFTAFFGKGYDYRIAETNKLFEKTKECFEKNGFFELNTEITKDFFLEECKINLEVIEDGDHIIYMKNKNGVEFSLGVTDYKNRCFFNVADKNRNLPKCRVYESEDKKDYLLVGSSQNSKRVAT